MGIFAEELPVTLQNVAMQRTRRISQVPALWSSRFPSSLLVLSLFNSPPCFHSYILRHLQEKSFCCDIRFCVWRGILSQSLRPIYVTQPNG